MPLNKSVGDMYDFVTHTWNPIKGCLHDCSYCYIKSIKNYSLEPRFSKKELITNLGKDNFIFVGSTADMFGEWVDKEWISRVLKRCWLYDNQYLFQTKNPKRFNEFLLQFPEKVILGTTIETNNVREAKHISKAPSTYERMLAMHYIQYDKEVTIEPILDFDLKELVKMIWDIKPKFVAIGADSKGHNLNEPSREKVIDLVEELKEFTEVKLKSNLKRILK